LRISVKVTPRALKPGIRRIRDRDFKIKVKALPEKGEANKEVVEIVADYFNIPKSHVKIIRGHTTRRKIIEIKNLISQDYS